MVRDNSPAPQEHTSGRRWGKSLHLQPLALRHPIQGSMLSPRYGNQPRCKLCALLPSHFQNHSLCNSSVIHKPPSEFLLSYLKVEKKPQKRCFDSLLHRARNVWRFSEVGSCSLPLPNRGVFTGHPAQFRRFTNPHVSLITFLFSTGWPDVE